MSHYTLTDGDKKTAKMQLELAEKNLRCEQSLLYALADIVEAYGDKVYNKRFETFVNSELGKKFGTTPVDSPYKGEPREYPNASVYMHSETYVSTKHTRLGYHFKGYDITTDYEDHTQPHRRFIKYGRTQQETFYGADDLAQLRQSIKNRQDAIVASLVKIAANTGKLVSLAREHDKLVEKIEAYNNKISYVIADNWRIK